MTVTVRKENNNWTLFSKPTTTAGAVFYAGLVYSLFIDLYCSKIVIPPLWWSIDASLAL